MKILLTGGAGYIGSHTAVEYLDAGHDVSVVDNLANSSVEAVYRVECLTNRSIAFHEADLCDIRRLKAIFESNTYDAVIHFAGLKAVGESVEKPLAYYRTNLGAAINLVEMMLAHNVNKLVFSSSATVYGEPERLPVDEQCPTADPANPYGRTKLMIEKILTDVGNAQPDFNAALLRYFNPAGAHESGEIGEDPRDVPNNLLPYITQVASGRRDKLTIFGNDYPTADGTCIRDYIHVVDLAKGHLAALNKLVEQPGVVAYNLGTGRGYSVMDVIRAFEKANNLTVPWIVGDRRPGDVPVSYTDPSLAKAELNWQAARGIEDICRDAWRWQQRNPEGYSG